MKLRSGKVINILPWRIEKKLNIALEKFKALLADDEQLALELIQLVSFAESLDTRHIVHEKVKASSKFYNEVLGFNNSGGDVLGTCGTLLMLITGREAVYHNDHFQPIFHSIIQEKMWDAFNWENFNGNIAGDTDQSDYSVSLIEIADQTSNDNI